MSRPIDYSKWDRIGEGDSSDEGEEQEQRGMPQITKFDAPMSVTIGGGGGGDGGPAAAPSSSSHQPTGGRAGHAATGAAAAAGGKAAGPQPPPPPRASSSSKVEDVAENGDELEVRAAGPKAIDNDAGCFDWAGDASLPLSLCHHQMLIE